MRKIVLVPLVAALLTGWSGSAAADWLSGPIKVMRPTGASLGSSRNRHRRGGKTIGELRDYRRRAEATVTRVRVRVKQHSSCSGSRGPSALVFVPALDTSSCRKP